MPRIRIARDALPYLGGLAAATILTGLFFSPWLALVWLTLFLFVAFFFRDPERTHAGEEGVVLSPADGRVVRIRDEAGARDLSIFLSVLDVHVNRAPVSGRVERVTYHPGRFQAAFRHGASSENERNEIEIRAPFGTVTAVQIAGLLARRIVCTLRPGDRIEAGQRIGMIKFGSRMDVAIPPGLRWTVSVGDRVSAGVTVLARGEARS